MTAALRDECAEQLGTLFWDQQEIVSLVQGHAPGVKIADLPRGSARTVWTYVLVELANRADAAALKALLDEAGKRSKRVAWSKFEALAAPVPGGTWSHLRVTVRWGDERADRAVRVASDQVVVEAEATLQWSGTRPPDPALALEHGPLLGARRRDTAAWKPDASGIAGIECWRATLPVEPGGLSTRRIAAIANDHRAVRYLVARGGAIAALVLWLALGAFVAVWLAPLGLAVAAAGLALGAALFAGAWWLRIARLIETAAPAIAVLAALTVALPPIVLVIVINRSAEAVAVAGDTLEPTGRRTLLGHPDLSAKRTTQCVCPVEPSCHCDEEPVRFVPRYEVQCRSVLDAKCADLQRVTLAMLIDGPTPPPGSVMGDALAPLGWPAGFDRLQLARGAFTATMKLTSGPQRFELSNVRITDRAPAVLALRVLAEPNLAIEFADRSTLTCAQPAGTTVRLLDVAPRIDLELELARPAGPPIVSRWHTAGTEEARACLAPAPLATITVARARAGQRIRLPEDLGIQQVRFGRNRTTIDCAESSRLRFVANPNRGVRLPFAHAALDDDVIATCIPSGFTFRPPNARTECTLGEDSLACRAITIAPQGPYEGPCTLTARGALEPQATPSCRRLEATDALFKRVLTMGRRATPRPLLCNVVYVCAVP